MLVLWLGHSIVKGENEMGKKKDKYIDIINKDGTDPREVYRPLKKQTEDLHAMFAKRRWVATILQQDIYRYFIYRINIKNPEDQLWICGDTLVAKQIPKSKVTIRSICMRTKKWCCGSEGSNTNEYFTICPHCKHVFVAVADSIVPCDYCQKDVDCNKAKRWIKYNCVNCPVNIGLDEANIKLDYAYNNQLPRSDETFESNKYEM